VIRWPAMGRVSDQLATEPAEPAGDDTSPASSTPVFDSLKPAQKKAIELYVSPDSPTFSNGAGSYRAAYPGARHPGTAAASMSRLLSNDKGQKAVAELMREHSVDSQHRIRRLREIMDGQEQTQTIANADGEIVRTVTTSPPQADALKAIDLLNRLDGSYAKAEQTVNVQAEAYKQLIRANRHLLQ
jgi:hypothetical protein